MTRRHNFNKFVLVVDDNETNREIASGLLKIFGCRTEGAANGREAVELVRSNRYDLILMDCQMPVMDGFQATAAIRRLENSQEPVAHTPVFAFSGNIQEQDRREFLRSGMDGYISKPFTQDDIRTILEDLFGEQK